MKRLIVGISGASGVIYGIRLLEMLQQQPEVQTHLILTSSAKRTILIGTEWSHREVPLHAGHCKLLYEASQLGIHIAPPMPAFYNHPQTIDDLINHSLGRVLDLFGIDLGIVKRWAGAENQKISPLR